MKHLKNTVVLNNGVEMPSIGYGVFHITDMEECEEAVYEAIKVGYRLIDTASAYENEEAVGRAIGVDNFTQDRLADFIFFNKIKPAVNLIECNAFYQRKGDLDYMNDENIQMQAWSPLVAGNARLFDNPVLQQLGQKYNKSVPQIVLRWLTEREIVPLVKSVKPQRIQENLDIFDFTLSQEDRDMIATLDTEHSCFPPRNSGNYVQNFLMEAQKYRV